MKPLRDDVLDMRDQMLTGQIEVIGEAVMGAEGDAEAIGKDGGVFVFAAEVHHAGDDPGGICGFWWVFDGVGAERDEALFFVFENAVFPWSGFPCGVSPDGADAGDDVEVGEMDDVFEGVRAVGIEPLPWRLRAEFLAGVDPGVIGPIGGIIGDANRIIALAGWLPAEDFVGIDERVRGGFGASF